MTTVTQYLDQSFVLNNITSQEEKPEYYASDISGKLGYTNKEDFDSTLARTLEVFSDLHLSAKKNCKQIFRFRDGEMVIDWKLSSLACYLMVLNGNPNNLNLGKELFFTLHSDN